MKRLKQAIDAAEESAAAHERQMTGMLDKGQSGGLTRALGEAGELVSQLRKRVQIDERIDQMSRREVDLEEQSQDHLEQHPTIEVVIEKANHFVLPDSSLATSSTSAIRATRAALSASVDSPSNGESPLAGVQGL